MRKTNHLLTLKPQIYFDFEQLLMLVGYFFEIVSKYQNCHGFKDEIELCILVAAWRVYVSMQEIPWITYIALINTFDTMDT